MPTPVPGGVRLRELAHDVPDCGLTDAGAAYCWGGYGFTAGDDGPIPTEVAGGIRFSRLSGGFYTTCGASVSGEVYCWGLMDDGVTHPTPHRMEQWEGLAVTHLSGNNRNRCALVAIHQLPLARRGAEWYCGLYEPLNVSDGRRYIQMDGGVQHQCAVAEDGAALCRGTNQYGEAGSRPQSAQPMYYPDYNHLPIHVLGGLSFRQVSAGFSFTCGITTMGDAYCWGLNSVGQLGDGTRTNRTEPTLVSTGQGT